jgi:hypothetical protein
MRGKRRGDFHKRVNLSITGGLLEKVYFYSVLSLLTITLSNFATGDHIMVLLFLASI